MQRKNRTTGVMVVFYSRIQGSEKWRGCFTEGGVSQQKSTKDFDAAYRCYMKNAVRLLYMNSQTALLVAQPKTANMKTLTTQFPIIIADIYHWILRATLPKHQSNLETACLRFLWNLHQMCPLMQKLENKCQNFGINILLPWRRAKRFWPFWCNLTMKMYEKCSKFACGNLFLCAVLRKSYIIYL